MSTHLLSCLFWLIPCVMLDSSLPSFFWSPVNRLDWQHSVILCQGTADIHPHFSLSSSHLLNTESLFQEQQL